MRVVQYTRTVTVREFSFRSVQFVRSLMKSLRSVNCMSLATLQIFSALLVKFERGPMSLRSVQFVRSVKILTVRKDEFYGPEFACHYRHLKYLRLCW